MTEYERGNAVVINTTLKDQLGTLVDPDDNKMYIEIKHVITETVKVEDTTEMTRSDTGTFSYTWQTSEDDDLGQYTIETHATYDSSTVLNRDLVDLVSVID